MYRIVVFAFTLYLTSFSYERLWGQNVKKIRIDPTTAFGGKVSEYFDSVEYIPLETSAKSMFGDVLEMVVTDSSFVIFDYDTHSILFFRSDGKFISRVTGGPNVYMKIFHDFAHKNIGIQYLNSTTRKDILSHYTYTGKLLSSRELPVVKNSYYSPVISLGNGYSARFNNAFLMRGRQPVDTTIHLISIYKNQKIQHSFFPVLQSRDIGLCMIAGSMEPPKIVENDAFYVSMPLDYRVYKVTPADTQFLFQFVFPAKRTLSKEIFNPANKRYLDSVTRRIPDDENTIIDVSNIFFRGSKLFFKLNMRAYTSYVGSDSKYQYNFIYDTLSSKLVSLERITADDKSYFLPFMSNRVNISGLDYNNGHFYTSISSLKMFTAQKNLTGKEVSFPPALEAYFKNQSRKSNPVIVRLKLKE